jgi:hypothetical protein
MNLLLIGRGERIRTFDPYNPITVGGLVVFGGIKGLQAESIFYKTVQSR